MSYIRFSSYGHYVEIPGGSQYYLYDDGERIHGYGDYGKFGAMIYDVAEGIGMESEELRSEFENHFGELDFSYEEEVARPERAEIFCQCVDGRFSGVKLSNLMHERVQEWAKVNTGRVECVSCGKPFIDRFDADNPICFGQDCSGRDES